jgi:2-octaprenyl-6-methoxyphenol hydroxylase
MKTKAPQSILKADIVISGGGPAGLTLGLLLGQAGLQVVIIDPETPVVSDQPTGRTAALLNSSLNVLRGAGIWPALQDKSTPLKIMRLVDDNGPGISVSFNARDAGHDAFGYNIPNGILKSALIESVQKQKNITLLAPARLSDYKLDSSGVIATTEDDTIIHARLIAGADGRNSRVRSVAGIDVRKHDYGQTAITCLINHTLPHNFTSTEHHRPGGPFTLVPMPGNVSSIVWVEKTEDAAHFLAMKKQDFVQAIQDRTRGIVGTIELASPPASWPLMLQQAARLTAPRAALVAEAAHVLSPIGAQGLNLSLRDVASLAETIIDAARLGEDIGKQTILENYEKRRSFDINTRVTGIDKFNRIVANDLFFLRDIRRLGLKGLETIPALKDLVMKQGLSPSADEGRLLRGETL